MKAQAEEKVRIRACFAGPTCFQTDVVEVNARPMAQSQELLVPVRAGLMSAVRKCRTYFCTLLVIASR